MLRSDNRATTVNLPCVFCDSRVKFKDDADEATTGELVRKSSVYDTLANPVEIKIEVEK